jgi:DNA-binding NarL/FixJ family response regulator
LADGQISLVVTYRDLLQEEFDIVGTSSDSRSLMPTATQLQPDVIVIDLATFLKDTGAGLELKRLMPQTKILAIAKKDDVETAADALHEWASGVLVKRTARRELVSAIRQLVAGKSYVAASIARCLHAMPSGPQAASFPKSLTQRQREVLKLLAEGRTMRDVADFLALTTRTVAFHKYRIMRDFGLHNNVDLLKLAIREHLASPE